MTTFTFDEKDILNSTIRLGPNVVFSTSTTRSIIHRDVTILSNSRGERLGSILWKGRGFVLFGQEKSMDVIKVKPHTFFDTNWERIWQWESDGPRYETMYSTGQWQAKELSTGAIHAVFHTYLAHLFKRSEPASVTFPNGVREFDQLFLLLIFMKMETRRLDTERSRRNNNMSTNNNMIMMNSAGQGAMF